MKISELIDLIKSKYIKREGSPGHYRYTYQELSPEHKQHLIKIADETNAKAKEFVEARNAGKPYEELGKIFSEYQKKYYEYQSKRFGSVKVKLSLPKLMRGRMVPTINTEKLK